MIDVHNYIGLARTIGVPVKDHGDSRKFQFEVEKKSIPLKQYISREKRAAEFQENATPTTKFSRLIGRQSIIAPGSPLKRNQAKLSIDNN